MEMTQEIRKELDEATAHGHPVTRCACGGPRVWAKRIPDTSRCLACRAFVGPESSSFSDRSYTLTDLDREVILYWQKKSHPALAPDDLDPRVVDLVSKALAQGHVVEKCSDCGGPAVCSKTRPDTWKCFRCGRFEGVQASASNEPQSYGLPYTMAFPDRLARYRKTTGNTRGAQRACENCGASLGEFRKGTRFCSKRCRQRAWVAA
jgi:hypothetical protein